MLRLLYLVFLYGWYDGRPSSVAEEIQAKSSDEESLSTLHPLNAAYDPSAMIRDSSEARPAPAPVNRSFLERISTRVTAATSGYSEGRISFHDVRGQSGRLDISRNDDSRKEQKLQLKRLSLRDKLTPLTMLVSIVSDIDVFADWYFFNEGLEDVESEVLFYLALTFTVLGTIMYVLLTLEFHPVSKVQTLLAGKRLTPLQHVPLGWQLAINVVVEDIPQFIITCLTSPGSAAGVLNIATAAFALMAKVAEGFSTRNDLPISSQLDMVDEDPGVVQHMMVQRRNAEELASNGAKLAVIANTFKEERDSKRQKALAFEVMQLEPGFLNRSLNYMREKLAGRELDLTWSGIKGTIPSNLGGLTQLEKLQLDGNRLTGSLPLEICQLTALTILHISKTRLTGPIPPALGQLTALTSLDLSNNKLSGSIPKTLGNLTALTDLLLNSNELSGSIPPELGQLTSLRSLHLYENGLTGSIPPELGRLKALTNLQINKNSLSGCIPPELGDLEALSTLHLSNNSLRGPIPDELRKRTLVYAWFFGNHFEGMEDMKKLLPNVHYLR